MSEPKFTKGPWRAGKNPCMTTVLDEHEGKAIYPEEGHHHIAWANALTEDGDLAMDTALANAALIAAAPELYEFAHFFETFAGQCYCRILGEAGQKIYDEAVKICKKARGEE